MSFITATKKYGVGCGCRALKLKNGFTTVHHIINVDLTIQCAFVRAAASFVPAMIQKYGAAGRHSSN
jgi:hypothetical protein